MLLNNVLGVIATITVGAHAARLPFGQPKPNHSKVSVDSSTAVTTVYDFPANTYAENLAVRCNGQILIDLLTAPQLWLVDPSTPGQAVLVHEFANANALGGIAEIDTDVFAVVVGNVTLATGNGVDGSWSIWSIDLASRDITSNETISENPPQVAKIADIPTASLLNGLAFLEGDDSNHLLAGDLKLGTIVSVDIDTGDYVTAVNNNYTTPSYIYGLNNAGPDGVQIRDDVLFWTNIGQGVLYRVPLDTTTGLPNGAYEKVATRATTLDQWDDFTFDSDGNVYIVAGGANTVEKIDIETREVSLVAGDLNSTTLAEPSAAKFGRRSTDRDVLYVTTAGGLLAPVNGDIVVGGQVVAIKTK